MNTISAQRTSPTGVKWVLGVAEFLIAAGHGVTVCTDRTTVTLATDASRTMLNMYSGLQATKVRPLYPY